MKSIKMRGVVAAVAGALMFGFGANAMADSTDDILNALIAKGVLTEEEGALLMKGRTGEKEAAEKKKASSVSAKYKDGLSFESGDGTFKAQINGRVHTDYRSFDFNDNQTNAAPTNAGNSIANVTSLASETFDLRRARLGFKATFKEYYDVEVVTDLTSSSALLDVGYLNVAWWKPVQFRVGVFKMPMNLEELTSSNNIDFMERSFVNQLSPTKEIGAMVHGTPFTGTTYALAMSNGTAKAAEGDVREDSKDVLGRLSVNFAEIMGNKDMVLHAAASYSIGDQASGTVGVAGRTEARGTTFFRAAATTATATLYPSIQRERIGLEGAVAYNNFKLQSEWMNQNNSFTSAVRGYDADTSAWYLAGMWTITGEKYAANYKNGAFGSIKPNSDFDPVKFTGGTWELGARYSEFDASDYVSVGLEQANGVDAVVSTRAAGFAKAKSYTAGVKFLPTSNMRFLLNYVQTDYSDVLGGATGGVLINNTKVEDEKAIIMRGQWMF